MLTAITAQRLTSARLGATLAVVGPLIAHAGCATTREGQPHEDQRSAWYHRIQIEESKIEVAHSNLAHAATESDRQAARTELAHCAKRICDTAALIGETDADLRCQMARRHGPITHVSHEGHD